MRYFLFLLPILCLLAAPLVYAQDKVVYYVYEKLTLEKLSQLYWALSKLDMENNADIDNYMMINDCDIYRDYSSNEFEWKNIRAKARDFLKENKGKFPLRYEVMQPIKLGEYNMDQKRFDIQEEYQIKGVRRFEALATDYNQPVCGFNTGRTVVPIPGYPRGLLVEFSRPLGLTSLPVDPVTAKNYISEKNEQFKILRSKQQTTENLHSLRDAYLLMKIKLFAYRKETRVTQGPLLAEVLGILEGIDIYADKDRRVLLHSEDYRSKKSNSRIAVKLADELPPGPLLSPTVQPPAAE